MSEAPQIPCFVEGETRNGKASFASKLDAGELLTGTPTITEIGTTDLTFANVALSTAVQLINGIEVAAAAAVNWKVTGFIANKAYRLLITGNTTAVPAQTLRGIARFTVMAST